MKERVKKQAQESLIYLRKRLPTAFPVRLAPITPKKGHDPSGAKFSGRNYILILREDLTELEVQDCIIHEYAHFRVWGLLQAQTYEHDGHWGIEFARVYTEMNEPR